MLELKLAIRFIFNLKKASFSSYASLLTIIGIAIGVAALMLTASIIDGFENEVSNKSLGLLFLNSLPSRFKDKNNNNCGVVEGTKNWFNTFSVCKPIFKKNNFLDIFWMIYIN